MKQRTTMPTLRCFVFDLDDVLLPTTQLFSQPYIQNALAKTPLYNENDVFRLYHSFIHPNLALTQSLHRLHYPKFILTNASRAHAHASLRALCIHHYFNGQLDANSGYAIKPNPQIYQAMHNHIMRNVVPRFNTKHVQIFFFDDKLENLLEPRLLGWTTVWIYGHMNPHQQNIPSFVNFYFQTIEQALQSL